MRLETVFEVGASSGVRYEFVSDVPISRASMVEDDGRSQIIAVVCSLDGRLKIDLQRAKGLYRKSVKLRVKIAAVLFAERVAPLGGQSEESDWSSSSASERSTGRREKANRRVNSSRRKQGADWS